MPTKIYVAHIGSDVHMAPGVGVSVVYVYYEDKDTKKNLEYFIENGIISSSNYSYCFVINGHTCSVPIPSLPNVYVLHKDNDYDIPSYREGLNALCAAYNRVYDLHIFINFSCCGPFGMKGDDWIEDVHRRMVEADAAMIGSVLEIPDDTQGYTSMDIPIDLEAPNMPFIHTYMFGITHDALLCKKD